MTLYRNDLYVYRIMRKWTFLLFALSCAVILRFPQAWAQDLDQAVVAPREAARMKRKEAKLFSSPAQATPAEQLAYAQRLRESGETRRAEKQFNALVHEWHDSPEAPVAQQAYAELLLERGKYHKAFQEYQYLIDQFAGRFPYERALSAQFRIAHEIMTRPHGGFLFFGGFKAPERAVEYFRQLAENAPNWDKTAQAYYFMGTIYEEQKRYSEAIAEYEKVKLRFPDNPMAAFAALRRAICLCKYADEHPRDEIRCREALSALTIYLRDHPGETGAEEAGRRLDELKKRLAAMYYDRALFYDGMRTRPQAALLAYEDFIKRFPWSPELSTAFARVEELKAEIELMAERQVAAVAALEGPDADRRELLSGYQDVIKRFPRTRAAGDAAARVETLKKELEAEDHAD